MAASLCRSQPHNPRRKPMPQPRPRRPTRILRLGHHLLDRPNGHRHRLPSNLALPTNRMTPRTIPRIPPLLRSKRGTRQAQHETQGVHTTALPKNRNHSPSSKITAIIVQKNHPAHPSPFCAAKGGRVKRSETQGVHTAALQKQKSHPTIKNHRNHSSKEPSRASLPFLRSKRGTRRA